MKTTPNPVRLQLWNPKGVFIGTRGPGDKPWPEARRAPRPYDRENAARAAFPRPCSGRARGVLSRAQSFLSRVSPCSQYLVLGP